MMICGIDPGYSGGIAYIETIDKLLTAERVPIYKAKIGAKKRNYLDVWKITKTLSEMKPDHCFIEKQQAMPQQGVSSTFFTGLNYGIYLGLLVALNVPYTEVHPKVWKKALLCNKDKELSRKRASELMPHGSELWSKKSDEGVAEAALIAYYGINYLSRSGSYEQSGCS
jgi:Holliday junction resolvasome RuvABC endonuclease subunit|tara:strand:- start:66 stop:572 length:507 start_codon:yes stop_codon:yes gene_type:complete